MKTEVWDSFAGQERAIWPIDVSDSVGSMFWGNYDVSDSDEDSDYDDDNNGGRKASGYDSDDIIGGARCTIYPGQDHPNCIYRHAHLRDFSRKAINQYNHQTGSTYEFVELVKASVVTTVKAAYIVVTFKACQSNDTMVTTSFQAETHSASKSLTGSYDIETVVPLH